MRNRGFLKVFVALLFVTQCVMAAGTYIYDQGVPSNNKYTVKIQTFHAAQGDVQLQNEKKEYLYTTPIGSNVTSPAPSTVEEKL